MFLRRFFGIALRVWVGAALVAGPTVAQELTLAPRDQFGQVVVTSKQIGAGSPRFEQAFGGEFDSEPAFGIHPASEVRKLARAVGRLDILFDRGTGYCTAFLISDTHLMTNAHCLSAGMPQQVTFTTGYVEFGVEEGTGTYAVNPEPLEISGPDDLDFAILEVFGNPARDWGKLDLAAVEMDSASYAGWPLLIIGHPIFQTAPAPVPNSQYVSRKECQATLRNAVTGNRLRHTCDTLPGNSGSPVFGDDSRKVIALHHAADSRDGLNFAVPMSLIAQKSAIVAALLTPEPTEPPRPTACDAALVKAQARNTCADFDAFLAQCADHPMAAFVKPFATNLCQSPVPQLSLQERMAADDNVQRCDALAGHPMHPDQAKGLMLVAGVDIDALDPGPAIAACKAALAIFADHPRLMANLGRAFTVAENYSEALIAHRKAADLKDPIAQNNLGTTYHFGRGVPQSDTQAVAWYRKAAEQGLATAQYNLGRMYRNGEGVPQSDVQAVSSYKKAAEQGHATAQFFLGWMYQNGKGVPRSNTQAVAWYRKAAEQSHAPAQSNLGWMYQAGKGVPKSDVLAVSLYKKSAE